MRIVHNFHFLPDLLKKYSMFNTIENNKVNEQASVSNKREKTDVIKCGICSHRDINPHIPYGSHKPFQTQKF